MADTSHINIYNTSNSDHTPGLFGGLVAALLTVSKRLRTAELRNLATDKGLKETETKSEELALDEHGRFGFTIEEAASIVS